MILKQILEKEYRQQIQTRTALWDKKGIEEHSLQIKAAWAKKLARSDSKKKKNHDIQY